MSDDKPKRKVPKTRYVGLGVLDGKDRYGVLVICTNSTEVRGWLQRHGEPNKTYQVACLIGEPVVVEVEAIEKRSLVPVEGKVDE